MKRLEAQFKIEVRGSWLAFVASRGLSRLTSIFVS